MERVRKNFCERDQLARHLGMELIELSPGHAIARMEIKPFHLNGADSVHGGAIFSLADFAFAAACNTHGTLAVAINAFLDPMRERRAAYEAEKGLVERVIYEGTLRASEEGDATLLAMRKAMGLSGMWNRISRRGREAIEREAKAQG